MSKRKRTTKSSGDEPTDDASAKEDMVHVTSDLLAGSPDVFADKKPEQVEAGTEPEPSVAAEPMAGELSEAAAAEAAETESSFDQLPSAEPAEPASENAAMVAAPAPEAVSEAPPAVTAPAVNAVTQPSAPMRRARAAGSSAALGIVLVVVGLFALLVVLTGVDLTQYGWPLFILLPGLTLLIVGFISFGAVATIPGGIVTMLGVVLAYANSTGDWPIWAYAWALIIPGGIGLGMYLQALRDRDQTALRTGRTLLAIGVMIFLIGFVLFESILGISGRDYFGAVGKAALPALLIIVGVILLVRSIQRSRQA